RQAGALTDQRRAPVAAPGSGARGFHAAGRGRRGFGLPPGAPPDSAPQRDFGRAKRQALPRYCRECDVLALCNGGCPKDRFIRTPDGEPGLNYLCAGFKRFFTHSRPHLDRLAAVWRAGQPMERLMREVRAADQSATQQARRNALCPCGSGRKYKKCCLGKPAR
ncbi:MAG: SEC-C domain-containing protein, partial [Candidatus Rokubacteria bacterium]|nr:SEC-C domain-containing protein [Candidatus Rokubacteria bacterium]